MAHHNFDQEKSLNAIETFKMDKGVISVRSLSEESDEKAYWHAKTPHERLEAVELMRQIKIWLRSKYLTTSKSSYSCSTKTEQAGE